MTCPTTIRQRFRACAIALTLFVFVSGCATRGRGFSGRFVKQGDPDVTFDAPDAAPKPRPASLGEYTRRLRTAQANARTSINLGTVLESKDPVLASALLKLSILPNAANHREVAQLYANAGITDFAYRYWQRALQLEPCDSSSLEGMARLWRQWGAPELALGDAHRAVHCRPGSASAYNTLGTVLVSLGQLANAKKAFEYALRLDDRAAFVLNNLCYVALQQGDGRAAQQACDRTLALDPTMTAAQANLALAYALQGDIPKAETRLLNHADPATGLYNVGVLRMSMNQFGEAATAFELATAARPSLADAARRAVQARAKLAAVKEK